MVKTEEESDLAGIHCKNPTQSGLYHLIGGWLKYQSSKWLVQKIATITEPKKSMILLTEASFVK